MQKELKIIKHDGVNVTDSREVAEMTGKRHGDLLETINGYVKHLENGNFRSQDFFIKDSYKVEGNNKTYDCYLLTRKGCDMVANKMTGEKGILFTATYVTKFEEMEKQISDPVQNYLSMSEEDRAILYFTKAKEAKQLEADNKKKDELLIIAGEKTSLVDDFLLQTGTYSIDNFSKALGIKELGTNNLHKYLRNNKIIMTDKYTYTDSKGKEKTGYGIKHFTAYAYYVEAGYFKHNLVDYYVGKNIADSKQNKAVLTAKGVHWLYKKLIKDGYIAKKTLETVITELESKLVA